MDIKTKCIIEQKLLGLGTIAVSIVSILVSMDATISVILIPMGLYTLFTKKNWVYEDYLEKHEN